MTESTPPAPPRPILARAAENGLRLGLYISALVIATGLSVHYAVASLIVWGGTIGMPFFVYHMLRRSSTSTGGWGFAELWSEGIASFFLGTLLPAAVAYVCLRFVTPTFISDTVAYAISYVEASGDAAMQPMADSLKAVVARQGLPTAADVAAQLISFNIIAGTLLSLIGALAVTVSRRRAAKNN